MTDMISVVARAICSGSYADADKCGGPGCDCGEWGLHVFEAKAALSALEAQGLVIVPREPSEAMLDAGGHSRAPTAPTMEHRKPAQQFRYKAGDIWQAMLAALEVK